jgi:uncharacterized protein DUF1573
VVIALPFLGCQRTDGHVTVNRAAADRAPLGLLRCSPEIVDLGDVQQGDRKEAAVTLINPGDAEVEIAKIESSCDCLALQISTQRLRPGRTVPCQLLLDMAKEPHFKGNLGIEIKGLTRSGALAFAIECRVHVERTSPPEGGQ